MVTALSRLKGFMAAGDYPAAVRLAAGWGDLGEHKERITRGQAARSSPGIYRDMGQDPAALFADAVQAIRERYGIQE